MAGWIKLHRKLKDHWLWQDAERLKWWLDILIEANHDSKKVLLKGVLVDCDRGQCVRSLETWAKEWRTTKKTVRHFFSLLEKDGMINTFSVTVSTRITVCNYDSYQDLGHAEGTQSKRKVNAEGTQSTPDIRREELKNEKKEKESLFTEFYDAYRKKVGRAAALKAWLKIDINQMPDIILKAAQCAKKVKDPQYQPHPSTWLNEQRWEDEELPNSGPESKVQYRVKMTGGTGEMPLAEWNKNHANNPQSGFQLAK